MDADFITVVAWIVGIVAVVEFFHIGYLVNAIRKDVRKQTKLLLASASCLVGKTGVMRDSYTVRILDEDWHCIPAESLDRGAVVTVKSMDGIALKVEAVK